MDKHAYYGNQIPVLVFDEEVQLEVLKFLIQIGSDVNVVDQSESENFTPLMLAAGRGFRAICELLLTQETGDSYDR